MTQDVLQYGAAGAVLLVLYAVIDKALVPLIKARIGERSNGGDGKNDLERRVSNNERMCKELSGECKAIYAELHQVRETAAVSRAILERIENRIK